MSPVNEPLQFGPIDVPASEASQHFLYVGTTGSGKTTLLRLLLQRALKPIGSGRDTRAIIRDAKQDVLPVLKSIAPKADIVVTHPFDDRGITWDISRDINEPQVALEFAFTLIPEISESQPFFSDAARHINYGVILSFMLSGIEWTLADMIRATQSVRGLKAILRKHPETRELVSLYLGEKRLASNVLSTVATKFLKFSPIAAAWESAKRRVSLLEWSNSEMIWVLGSSEISRHALQTLNRCMFKRASDLTLSKPDSAARRDWFVVDELADAGPLDGFSPLAKKGRSKGGCLAVAFQSVAGLRDSKMYGSHVTEEILAQFGHRAVGRLECAASAEWASQLIGDQEIEQVSHSVTHSSQGVSKTESRQTVMRRAMLPSEFLSFKPCNVENGLTAMYSVPSVGVFQDTIDGKELFEDQLLEPADIPAFVPRAAATQYLRPWTPEQAVRFGVPERRPKRSDERLDRDHRNIDRDEFDELFS